MAIKSMVPERFTTLAFLGPELNNQPKLQRIDTTADALMTRNVLAPKTAAEVAAQNGQAIGLIGTLGGGADQVNRLEMRADPVSATTQTEKDRANEALDTLAKATFIVMQYCGDQDLRDALNTPAGVDAILPPAMQGLGERIMANIITNPQIMAELTGLDTANTAASRMGAAGDRFMLARANASLGRLINMPIPHADEDEQIMALAYIGTVAGELNDIVNPPVVAAGGGAGGFDYAGDMLKMEEKTSRRQFGILVNDFMIETAWEAGSLENQLFFTRPELVGVEGYNSEEGLKRWQSMLRISLAAMNFTRYKRGGAKPEEILSMPGIGNAELEKIKTNELGVLMSTEPAFREAARRVFRGIFEREIGKFPSGRVRTEYTDYGRFFIKARKGGDIDTSEYMASMDRIVKGLVADGYCDENMAKIFVSMAGHLFVDGSMAIDSADIDRKNNNRTPDPDRVLIHPLWKAIQKAGFRWDGREIDGRWNYNVIGRVGDLVQKLVALDRKTGSREFTNKLLNGDWRYIPERTGASWTEMSEVKVQMRDGSVRVMCPAEFLLTIDEKDIAVDHVHETRQGIPLDLLEGRPNAITFGMGADDHIFGSFSRDWWPAMVLWGMAFKGKLPMKDANKEMGAFLSDWSNKMQDLRKIEIPGFREKWLAAHPNETEVPDDEMQYLLDPWLRDPESIVGGILNVIDKELLVVDTPLLPDELGRYALAARTMIEDLTGLDDDERQAVYDVLRAPNLTGMGELRVSALFAKDNLAGRLGTSQAQERTRLKEQSVKNRSRLKN